MKMRPNQSSGRPPAPLISNVRHLKGTMNRILFVVALLSLAPSSFAEECDPLPEKAEKFIRSFTEEDRGAEYCRSRKVARADIDSDGIEDLIVIFTSEGSCRNDKPSTPGTCGNHHETYLKVFLGTDLKEVPIQLVGRRGERRVVGLDVKNGVIRVKTLDYGKNDPMCCPSVNAESRFVVKNGALEEVRP